MSIILIYRRVISSMVDTEHEKITEANTWLIALAIMIDHDGWENGEFGKGEKWLPITFSSNEIRDEKHLAALIYPWGNDVDAFNDAGECRFYFAHQNMLKARTNTVA